MSDSEKRVGGRRRPRPRPRRSGHLESRDEDGGVEMGRRRDRRSKDDRARDRSGRSKRRRVDRHASNGDEAESSSDDSNNGGGDGGDGLEARVPVRLPPPQPNSGASVPQNHRRRGLAAADGTIGVPVPRKARSSSKRRPLEFAAAAVVPGGGEPMHASPARPSPPPPTQMLPSSSTARKKKPIGRNGGDKLRPEKATKSPSLSEDLEIEVAEVLFGLTRQFPPRQEPETEKLDLNLTIGANNEANASSNEGDSRGSPTREPQPPVLAPSNPSSNAMPATVLTIGVNKEANAPRNEGNSGALSPIAVSPQPQEPQPPVLVPSNPSSNAMPATVLTGVNKEANASRNEGNSRALSPIAVSPQPQEPQPPVLAPSNLNSNAMPATALEGERQRLDKSLAVPSTLASSSKAKKETSKFAMVEASSLRSEKKIVEDGCTDQNAQSGNVTLDIPQDLAKPQKNIAHELDISLGGPKAQDRGKTKQKEATSSMEECPPLSLNINMNESSVPKVVLADGSSRKSPKFSFGLMVPRLGMSSSDREGLPDYGSTSKAKDSDTQTAPEGEIGNVEEGKNTERSASMETDIARLEARTNANSVSAAEVYLMKIISEERALDLHLVFDEQGKPNPECNNQQVQKQPTNAARMEHGPDSSAPLQLPMSVEGWPGKPGSIPSFGYMAQVPPLQAVVPSDGLIGCSKPVQRPRSLLPENSRNKCAAHCYIARNIYYHQQQLSGKSPDHPASGAMPLYGPKHPDINAEGHYNLNSAPPSEPSIPRKSLQGNVEATNSGPAAMTAEKLTAAYASHSTGNAFAEAAQRKHIVFQRASQPGSSGNLLNHSAFISPSQQQAALGPSKPIPSTGNAETSSKAAKSGASGPVTSFNYPVLPTNEAHYMSLLQNSGYPFPIPAHAAAPAVHNGGFTVQQVPFFNGHFYSQMLPPQLQQHQRQQASSQQPSNSHTEMGRPSTSASSGSSSSQKAPKHSQQAPGGGPTGASLRFPASKQQWQQLASQCEKATESPSTANTIVMQAQKNIYGHNLAMATNPQNYAFISPPAAVAVAASGSGSRTHSEKQQPTPQHRATGVDLNTRHPFSFATAAAPPGLDLSMARSHALFHSLPDAAKHEYRTSAAATGHSLQKKQPHRIAEDENSSRLSNRAASTAPATSNVLTAPATSNSQQQQQQHQQLIQLQKQHQKLQMHHQISNQLPGGSAMSKLPQALAGFPQNFLQNTGTAQQRRPSNRETTPAPAATPSSKNQVAQQQGRSMQQSPLMTGHQNQIAFDAGLSLKAPAAARQQHLSAASSNAPLSAVAGMASGSSHSPASKTGGSLLASSSKPGAPSILGQHPMTTTMNISAKQQQQMLKQQMPHALLFSNLPYIHGVPSASRTTKASEQNPTATGNDNVRAPPPEKK